MAIRKHKPTSPGRRFQTVQVYDEITTDRPYRPLTKPLKKSGGRNNRGEITVWWRGGGHKRAYRIIDFKRDKYGVPAKVATVEYDPNRSARISLLNYADGEKRYILQPQGLKVGDTIVSGEKVDILPGNALPLKNIPLGTLVHNVELRPGRVVNWPEERVRPFRLWPRKGSTSPLSCHRARPGCCFRHAWRRLVRLATAIMRTCRSGKLVGTGGWVDGPHVRGIAMNPVDHPLGGGEGHAAGGRHPVSPWGVPAKGFKTRHKKPSDRFILQRKRKRGRK